MERDADDRAAGRAIVDGQVTWTFETVDGTNLQTFSVTIRSQHAWLPITTTVTSAITPSNQPPARISTQGDYPSPRGCTRHAAQRRQRRDHATIDADFSGVDCSSCRTPRSPGACVDQDGVSSRCVLSIVRRRFGSFDTGLQRGRLGRRVSEVVPDRACRRSGCAGVGCTSATFQAWLRHRNANGWNVYVSVNAVSPGALPDQARRSRAVRHVFLEADQRRPGLLGSADDAA